MMSLKTTNTIDHAPIQVQTPDGAMQLSAQQRLEQLSPGDVSAVIQMAWEDRTTFETIYERVGLSEPEVIRLMRAELNSSSFRLWRMRMKGRTTKHRALRNPEMKFDDRAIADHRRGNC
jgi:uncharacterized protein (TIGR03643 family)